VKATKPSREGVSRQLEQRIGARSAEENKRSACEDLACELEDYMCYSAVVFGVCDSVILV
jgi:hypothetical protein